MLRGYALKGHSWLLARSGHDKKKLQRGVRAPCWSCWLVWLLWQSQQIWSLAQSLALGKPVWPIFLFQSTATLWPRCQDGLLRVCWWSGVRSPVGAHGLFSLFFSSFVPYPGSRAESDDWARGKARAREYLPCQMPCSLLFCSLLLLIPPPTQSMG